jgi:hypothetical protein
MRPLHITRTTLTLGGCGVCCEPALSAPAYEHQLQRNPMILGSKVPFAGLLFVSLI